MALTAVNGIAENTNTPASSCHAALQGDLALVRLGGGGRGLNSLPPLRKDEEMEERRRCVPILAIRF